MKVGVFDSGIGGLSVAQAIERALPDMQVVFRHDNPDHFPYATKEPSQIYGYVVPVLQSLVRDGCEVIVIACNTVSTTLIKQLRDVFAVPLIAVEPMIELAATSSTRGIIAVCATPTTLASQHYAELKHLYAQGITVVEPDCANWSLLIERNEMNKATIHQDLQPALAAGADIVVLGCTHYHWIEDEIRSIMGPNVQIIQPETAVIEQLKQVLVRLP